MKTLRIGFLMLVLINSQLGADEKPKTNNTILLNIDGQSEVSVKGFIDPIEYSQYNFHTQWDALANLRAAEPEKQYSASIFRAFLPQQAVSVGHTWPVEQEGVLELLSQLHPRPQLDMHIDSGDSRGLWASLRAYNNQFAEIVFRIHAEFALTDGWFTPSQFAGRLVIDRTEDKVAFFQMYVPQGTVNFDVGWMKEKDIGISDIGFCPRMELLAGTQDVMQGTQFTEAITKQEAERALILRFYKSEHIKWVPMDKALEMAQSLRKPIHVVSIDGPLKDESC